MPDTTLQVEGWYNEHGPNNDDSMDDFRLRRFDIRRVNSATMLFDLDRRSFLFPDDATVTVKYSLQLDFEELPSAQQFRIADLAATEYEAIVQGDPQMGQYLRSEGLQSRAKGRASDMRSHGYNVYKTGENHAARRMNRVPRDWR